MQVLEEVVARVTSASQLPRVVSPTVRVVSPTVARHLARQEEVEQEEGQVKRLVAAAKLNLYMLWYH